jgi:hypothetical protein
VIFATRILCCAFCLVPLGCDSECRATFCGAVDRGPLPGDYAVELDTAGAFVSLEIDGQRADAGLTRGQFVFTADDPTCAGSATTPCTIVLQRLQLDLGSFTLPASEGELSLTDVVLSVLAPIELVNAGSGYVLTAGNTGVRTCASVNGTRDAATVALGDDGSMNVDFPNETLSVEGRFPLRFRAGSDGCEKLDATATVIAAGRSPWIQRP